MTRPRRGGRAKGEDHEQPGEVERATRAERTPVGHGGRRRSAGHGGRASRGWLDEHWAVCRERFCLHPRPRPHDPDHPLRGDVAGRLQEHRRGRELEPGEHGADLWRHDLRCRRPRPRPQTPTTLYAGTARGTPGGGVFKSTDGGASWSPVNTGLTYTSLHVPALALDPTTPTTLYAGTDDGVFKSTDGGGSWSPVNTGLTCGALSHLQRRRPRPRPHDPDHPLRGDDEWRRLQEHGRGRELEPGEHGAAESRHCRRPRPRPHDPDHPLRGDERRGVFKSTDGGASWSAVNTGLPSPCHVSSPSPSTPRPRPPSTPGRTGGASSRARTGARAGAR